MLIRRHVVALILTAILITSPALQAYPDNRDRELKVMTYNMYLGAELGDIFAATSPTGVLLEVGEAYNDMLAGQVPARIGAIADQIAVGEPTLVGLQEVALWRTGPAFDPEAATNVTYDFLQILLDELDARDLHYAPIAIQTNLVAELPGIIGPNSIVDVQYTDRLVILARTDLSISEFHLDETHAGAFATAMQVPVLNQTVTVLRGWTSADVKFRGKQYRFVNTHLESFSEMVQNAQANELLAGPASSEAALILVGDFNSDAAAGGSSYQLLTAAGFRDVWSEANPGSPGFTWALSGEIPSDEMTPTQRLDLILTRGHVRTMGAELVGEETADETPLGFKPSDHAGLFATIVLKP